MEQEQETALPVKSAIFDLDGTLTDTEKFYRICWPAAFAEAGYHMTDQQALALRSLGRPFAPALLKKWFGEDLDYWGIRERRKELMNGYLADGIPLKPGAEELLAWLKAHKIRIALATANDKERADRYLKQIGLYDYFDEICCATMVKEGKPAPDVYQFACRQLGLSPEECMAVEDSPNGVRSAASAGCRVVMVPDLTQPDEELQKLLWAKADCLLDIIELLQKKE